jgi:hypothetical protein
MVLVPEFIGWRTYPDYSLTEPLWYIKACTRDKIPAEIDNMRNRLAKNTRVSFLNVSECGALS